MSEDVELRSLLAQQAQQIAHDLERGEARLNAKIADLNRELAEVEAKRKSARRATQRLLNYPILIGRQFQCPSCWIHDEARSSLTSPRGTDDHDIMRCRACGWELIVPFDK